MGNIGGGSSNSSSSFGLKRGGATADSNTNSSSPAIFAFWTPFLLLHLGGPDTITAYSMEDNELWLRHLMGLLFQLISACVIFFCSLHSNPMIHGTVLMFVMGIIKYGERTYSLYCGSLERFRSNVLGPPAPGRNYAKLIDAKEKGGPVVEVAIPNGEASKQALDNTKSVEARAYELFLIFRRLFVNLILSVKERRQSQALFLERENMKASEAFEVIELELNFIYDMVYTKAPVANTIAGWVLRSVCSACLVCALGIFYFLDKPGHQIWPVDVSTTYALLLGGLVLDAAALLMIFFSNRAQVYLDESRRFKWLARLSRVIKRRRTWRWSRTVAQFNLISYCLGVPDSDGGIRGCCLMVSKMMLGAGRGLAELPLLQDFFFIHHQSLPRITDSFYIEDAFFVAAKLLQNTKLPEAEYIRKNILEEGTGRRQLLGAILESLVKEMQKAGFTVMGDYDATRINTFNNILDSKAFHIMVESFTGKDLDDHRLLLCHIATDLCLHKDKLGPPAEYTPRLQAIATTLSEYMLYLLIKQPEMLSARTGVWLMRYRDTCEEARRFFGTMEPRIQGHDDARRMLLSMNTLEKPPPSAVKSDESFSVLFDAVILAKSLRELDEEVMWAVITGIWGAMLVYTAKKCPGSTHMKQLNRGGELISVIWLLMENMASVS